MAKWDAVFLKDAHERISDMMDGYDVSLRDVKDFVSHLLRQTQASSAGPISPKAPQTLADTLRWRCARMK